ncbi:hypothetical protein AZE42_08563 [Rhizopogon vesiculosus]|uniref:Uncharacterized protein n=1 Tax=Rhizopogon vesiculosus TaxID=180088 RepID=A0A1J8Q8F4_9AGAM|nr:hypothetical protein AZE42_08563 [Rhizopogon vesiculosus]
MSQMEGVDWKLRRELSRTGVVELSSAYDTSEHEFEHPTPTHPPLILLLSQETLSAPLRDMSRQSQHRAPHLEEAQIQTLLQPRNSSHHQIDDRSVYTPVEARIGGYPPDQWYPQDTQRIPLISDTGMRKSRSARQITTIISIDDIEHSHSGAFSIDAPHDSSPVYGVLAHRSS